MRLWTLWGMIGVLGWATLSAQAVRLAFNDTAGAARTYHSDIALTGSFTAEGVDEAMPLTGHVTFTMVEKVLAVKADGTASVSNEITDGGINMTLGEQEVKYPLKGYKATFDRSPQGKVTNLKSTGDPTSNAIDQMQTMGFGSEWKLIAELGQRFALPAKDLQPGDCWDSKQSEEVSPGNAVTMTESSKLIGNAVVEGNTYQQIDSTTTLTTPEQKTKSSAAGMSIAIAMQVSMTAKSTTYFDAQAGQIFRTAYTGATNMHMTVDGPTGPLAIKGTMNMDGGMKKVAAQPADA